MRKLSELNGWDLTVALAELAEPVGNLVNDDTFWDCFVNCTKKGVGVKQNDAFRFLLQTYSQMIPLLLKEHQQDTFRILSIIEGKPIEEVMQMNGMELFEDIKEAFQTNLLPFFTKSRHSAKRGSSSH